MYNCLFCLVLSLHDQPNFRVYSRIKREIEEKSRRKGSDLRNGEGEQLFREEAGASGSFGLAVRDALELLLREWLGEEANLELDGSIGGVGLDGGDGDPDEELLGLDAGEIGDGTVGELPTDGLLIVDEVGELDVARRLELDHELTVRGERVALHRVGEEPRGEPVRGERIVHLVSGDGGSGEEEEGGGGDEPKGYRHGSAGGSIGRCFSQHKERQQESLYSATRQVGTRKLTCPPIG